MVQKGLDNPGKVDYTDIRQHGNVLVMIGNFIASEVALAGSASYCQH